MDEPVLNNSPDDKAVKQNKQQQKSRLSLNTSSGTLKSKLVECTGQASIIKFFQRKTPVLETSSSDAQIISENDEKKKKKKKKRNSPKSDEIILIQSSDNNTNDSVIHVSTEQVTNESAVKKVNAFRFMMDSRYKSIGQNSPGKELEKVEESPEVKNESKKRLQSRKEIFQEWAERKGSKKRKIEDDEKGIIIEGKLKKRAKRLKKMLNIEQDATVTTNTDCVNVDVKSNEKSTNKHKHNKENGICEEVDLETFRIKEESGLTTQTLHKWKMKLKVCFEEEDKISNLKSPLKINTNSYSETDSTVIDLVDNSNSQKEKLNLKGNQMEDTVIDLISNTEQESFDHKIIKKKFSLDSAVKTKSSCSDLSVKRKKNLRLEVKLKPERGHGEDSAVVDSNDEKREIKKKKKSCSNLSEKNGDKPKKKISADVKLKPKSIYSESSIHLNNQKREIKKTKKFERKCSDETLNKIDLNDERDSINKHKKKCTVIQSGSDSDEVEVKPSNEKVRKKTKFKKSGEVKITSLLLKLKPKSNESEDSAVSDLNDEKRETKKKKTSRRGLTDENSDKRKKKLSLDVKVKPKHNHSEDSAVIDLDDEKRKIKKNKKLESKRNKETIIITDLYDESDNINKREKKCTVIYSSSDSDEGEVIPTEEKPNKKTISKRNGEVKIAPLFIMSKGKPKVDKAMIEARKQFLHSTMPESVKKVIDKEKRLDLDIPDYEVFPTVSHIRMIPDSKQLDFLNLPSINLNLTPINISIPNIGKLSKGCITNVNDVTPQHTELQIPEKIKSFRHIVKKIKLENPDYPIYKVFKSLYKKSNIENRMQISTPESSKQKRRRGRSKRKLQQNDEVQIIEVPKTINSFQIWTDLYRPENSIEIFGNRSAVSKLKTWLESWVELNLSANLSNHRDSNSSSDFDSGEENRTEKNLRLENTFIVIGPNGSGKTAAIYAVCNELNINVLEINASSKRTGKRLLIELQEATQSYQVKKKSALSSFMKSDNCEEMSTKIGKMCVLLIEDIDLVYEQDDGFISALSQLVAISKRPIILTTTDSNCLHLQKFSSQFTVITFSPLSCPTLAPWLQLVCLIEGILVSKEAIVNLLDRNNGDVRKTILQLQFWVQSGGEFRLCESSRDYKPSLSIDEKMCEDDNSNLSWLKDEGESHELQYASCVEFSQHSLPNLGSIWWNSHITLGMPAPKRSVEKQETNNSTNSQLHFKEIFNYFESLVMTDMVYKKFCVVDDVEPVNINMQKVVVDSLELSESEGDCTSMDACCEWACSLYKGCLKVIGNEEISQANCSTAEKRWQSKLGSCKNYLYEILPQMYQLQRNAANLDYFSTLRTMCRLEKVRANHNSRRNRFYNYLQGLRLHRNETYFKIMSDAFYLDK